MEKNCIFCKIASREVPSKMVYSDEDFVVIMDINPYCRGHLLVIPKAHSRWVWDVEEEEYLEYMRVARKAALVLRGVFGTDYVQEAVVGEDVEHCHVHLFPRVKGDGLPVILTGPMEEKLDEEEMGEIFEKVKAGFEGEEKG